MSEDVLRNYNVYVTMVVRVVSGIAARTAKEAAQEFRDDESKSFDQLLEVKKYKITKVERIG